MRAARIHRFGGPEVIVVEEAATPQLQRGEMLVAVAAAGVGHWDALVRSGNSVLAQPLPLTLGADLSGTVIDPGDSAFAAGDEIYGVTNERFVGAYAERAVVQTRRIARRPHSLDALTSASVPVLAVTAVQMLERAQVGVASSVLIFGAAGNVGRFAVQFAKRRGARVIAAIASGEAPALHNLGVDTVIDARHAPLASLGAKVDAVIDLVGPAVHPTAWPLIAREGRFVSAVAAPDAEEAARRGITASFLLVDVSSQALESIAHALDAGEVAPFLGPVLPLDRASDAHRMLAGERPHAAGRIVLDVTRNSATR